ncbi:F-box-like protein [Ceratobasidium sp. AG-Ba]|nr:F-box-like protein [Ceratobasidium sp. AG-Ba]
MSEFDAGVILPSELLGTILDLYLKHWHAGRYANLTSVALVCREWRNQTYATLFRNLEIGADALAIRNLTELCHISAAKLTSVLPSSSTTGDLPALGSFIKYITITLGQPTGHGMTSLSDLIMLLYYTPNIRDLALSIIQPDQVARHFRELPDAKAFRLPTLSSLRIRSYADASQVLTPLVARCHALNHLSLEVLVDNNIEREYNQDVICPGLVSFRSLGCWDPNDQALASFILDSSNTSLRAIELHRSPSPMFLRKLASLHGARIESLTLRSMEPASIRIWTEIIDQFTALQHLSLWYFPEANLLDSVNTESLRHFEFRRPWSHSNKDEGRIVDVTNFLRQCPSLRAVTYHSAKPIELVNKIAQERNLALTWKENHYVDGYMEEPRDFQAVPYISWKTHAFLPPLPRMTKPRAAKANINGYDTSGWDLPIHSAKSDLFL